MRHDVTLSFKAMRAFQERSACHVILAQVVSNFPVLCTMSLLIVLAEYVIMMECPVRKSLFITGKGVGELEVFFLIIRGGVVVFFLLLFTVNLKKNSSGEDPQTPLE